MKLVPETPHRLPALAALALVLVAAGSVARASEERPSIDPLTASWAPTGDAPSNFANFCPVFYDPTADVERCFCGGENVYLPSNTWIMRPIYAGWAVAVADPPGRRYLGLSIDSLWTYSPGGDVWVPALIEGDRPYYLHQAVFDGPRNRVITFDFTYHQVWQLTLDGTPTWSMLGSFPNSQGYTFYDPIGDRLLLVSLTRVYSASLSDPVPTWTYQTIGGTIPGAYGRMVFDVRGYRILDWGGGFLDCTFAPCFMNWQGYTRAVNLSGTPTWARISTSGAPPDRTGHLMTYDFVRNRLIMSGGHYHPALNPDIYFTDTWTLNLDPVGAGTLALDPAGVDFGVVPGWGVYQQTLEITNVGDAPSVIYAIVSMSANVTVSPKTFALTPNASRTVTIEWNGAEHTLDTHLEIESSDPAVPLRNVPVTGSSPTVGIGSSGPSAFGLALAGRNPVEGSARLELAMATSGAVDVAVHDVRGAKVRTLVDGMREAGRVALTWDGRDESGRRMSAGVYFVRARSGAAVAQAKVVLAR